MGRMESRGGIVDWKNLEKKTREALSMVGLEIDPHKEVRDLSISHRQLIEIAKAVSMNASLIIMDEPNSSLSDSESEKLFEVIAQLKARNVSIIYVSHKISEVIRISDRISVLRDGHFMGTSAKGDATANSIIEMMVGRNVNIERPEGTSCDTNKILLEVKNLSGNAFENVSFTLHVGEVMGFAGLVGAGRSEVARAIFGADPIKSGEIFFEGQKVHFNLPSEAIYKGLSMVPEDRKLLSLFMDMPILYNMSIANLPRQASSGFIKNRAERETAQNYVESLSVKLSNLMAPVRSLSGGNQQKTVLARWLATNPKVLILDEPTHGVDVGAKSEIYQLIRQLASKGMGIILISSELPEIMALSDRVVVMHQGKMTALLEREEATEARIMACALA